jgi:general stress protein 26
MTDSDIYRLLYQFLAEHTLGVLGTIGPDGTPQSALVGIAATPELEIIFDTVSTSRKYRNLKSNPVCSFVVGWSGEVTVQYEGTAHEPESAALQRYQRAYFERWPDGPSRLSWPGITYFAVRPTWIRYSDFSQNPPRIKELTFEAGG